MTSHHAASDGSSAGIYVCRECGYEVERAELPHCPTVCTDGRWGLRCPWCNAPHALVADQGSGVGIRARIAAEIDTLGVPLDPMDVGDTTEGVLNIVRAALLTDEFVRQAFFRLGPDDPTLIPLARQNMRDALDTLMEA